MYIRAFSETFYKNIISTRTECVQYTHTWPTFFIQFIDRSRGRSRAHFGGRNDCLHIATLYVSMLALKFLKTPKVELKST